MVNIKITDKGKTIYYLKWIRDYGFIKIPTNELYPTNNTQEPTEPSKDGYSSSYTQQSKGGTV